MDTNALGLAFAADTAAVVMMLGTLLHIRWILHSDQTERNTFRYYRWFARAVIAMALIDYFYFYVEAFGPDRLPKGGILAAVGEMQDWLYLGMDVTILNIFMTTVLLYLWLSFLCWYLYRDREYILRKLRIWSAPLLISGVVGIAAVLLIFYTGKTTVVFWIAYILFGLIRVFYFLFSLWMLHVYKEQDGVVKFFNIQSFFLPMFAGWLLEDFFDIPLRALGSALGVICLYLSMVRKLRYVDPETGYYNMAYIPFLKKLIRSQKRDYQSAVNFTVKDAAIMAELSKDLSELLPPDCEAIRRSEREIMVLLKVRDRGPLSMLTEDVKQLHDAEAVFAFRGKTESAEGFLERMC